MPDTSGTVVGEYGVARCWWCAGDSLYERYHDLEWGHPSADDRRLFEKLCLEGFQSGLSWLTILRKRENFRKAFKNFDVSLLARFNARTVERLLTDPGIVRNRAKIEAVVNNARQCRRLADEFGSLSAYVWSFEPDPGSRPRQLDRRALMGLPVAESATTMSKDLKRRGWAFVGPTTIYAFMEAMGLVNDHLSACHVHAVVEEARARFRRPTPPPSPST